MCNVHPLPPRAKAPLRRLGLEAFQDGGHSGPDVLDRLEVGSFDDIPHLRERPKVTGSEV